MALALDLTVHDADTIRFLLRDEIVEVVATTASDDLGKGVVEDSAMGVLRTARASLVSFHDSFTVPHAPTGVEIFGTTGCRSSRRTLSRRAGRESAAPAAIAT